MFNFIFGSESTPNFTKKNSALVNKKFWELFFPTVLNTASIYLGNVVNGIIVGNLIDPLAMASIYACIPLNQMACALALLISIGAAGMISISAAARENEKADYIFSAVLTLGIICSFFILMMLPFTHEIAKILSVEEKLHNDIQIYLSVFICRTTLIVFIVVLRNILKIEGMAKLLSQSSMIQQGLSIILTVIFIKYFELGIFGAGCALITGDIACFIYMVIGYSIFQERKRRFINIFKHGAKKFFNQSFVICKSGFPAAIALILATIKVWTIYQILGELGGASAMVMYSICIAGLSILSVLVGACCDSSMPIIGMLYGEKDFISVRKMLNFVLKISLTLIICFVSFVFIFPQTVLNIYGLSSSEFENVSTALRLFTPSLIGAAFSYVMIHYYSIIQKPKIGTLLSLTEGILIIMPTVFIFSKIFGVNGVWLSFGTAEVISFIILMIYVKKFGGKFKDISFTEYKDSDILYDISIKASIENSVKVSAESIELLENKSIDKKNAIKVGIALEEIVVNIANLSPDKIINIDIRIKLISEKHLMIIIRDNGILFNPVTYQAEEKENFITDGIMLMKALATDIKYNRILGLNQTVIEF